MSQTQAQLVGNVVTGAVFAGIVTAASANIGEGAVGINSSGIDVVGVVTATEYYGTFKGTIDTSIEYANNAGVATYATSAGIATYATTSGISTVSEGLTGTPNLNVGIITATEYYGDGSNLDNLPEAGVGIQSGGISVGTGITTLNFIGAGNTFAVDGTRVDISISSGGGGGASVSISTVAPTSPSDGDLWFDNSDGNTYIWYDSQSVWVVSQTYGY